MKKGIDIHKVWQCLFELFSRKNCQSQTMFSYVEHPFADIVTVKVWVAELKGVRLKIGYKMTKADGTVVCEGASEHCFLDRDGKIISLKRTCPQIYAALAEYM